MTPIAQPVSDGTRGLFLEKSGRWAEVRLPGQGDAEACAGYRGWDLIRRMATCIVKLDDERCALEDVLTMPRPDWERLADEVARQMFEAGVVKVDA